jgi:hypothetical protein
VKPNHAGNLPDALSFVCNNRATIDRIFAHPISHNLAWTEIVKMVDNFGHVETRSDNEFAFEISGAKLDIHKPHKRHLNALEVIELRHFLKRAALAPPPR